ncbi:MAG TPA: tRNA preQ1(34) S-adenosylmethionine ribosyltransferase-isomerase QueA [Tepidisphaeraceae bacterium]|jgi:S-adenosylmethionine:tRNA ribosyltransferase-isomerase|nr:tRNA preQ1(34) S-adenosylmethionine ribosyltransferase-isomerase QueA [Tepidisphaeraceae bacterium]
MTDDVRTPHPTIPDGSNTMQTDDLDFDLPADLIAQTPPPNRSDSRLLHYVRSDRAMCDRSFSDLPDILRPTDALVFNDSKVIPARFMLKKTTGGQIEGLFLCEPAPGQWLALLRDLGHAPPGTVLHFDADPSLRATILSSCGAGEFLLQISDSVPAMDLLTRIGRMPLPPYIKREKRADARDDLDRARYQTVYAAAPGAIAAPTAGLHFTPDLLRRLDEAGISRVMVTLHVGAGTFKPITAGNLADHRMHSESFSITPAAAEALNRAKKDRRRIVAVGTTSARVLESHSPDQPFTATHSQTSIFIYPPYRWNHVGALITNFHLPRSTLIALVAALTGLDEQRRIYQHAIAQRYRFFSYGDAMLIE